MPTSGVFPCKHIVAGKYVGADHDTEIYISIYVNLKNNATICAVILNKFYSILYCRMDTSFGYYRLRNGILVVLLRELVLKIFLSNRLKWALW